MSTKVEESFAKLLHSPDGAADAIRESTRQAMIHHGLAGRSVPVWREDRVVWVKLDENGEIVGDA